MLLKSRGSLNYGTPRTVDNWEAENCSYFYLLAPRYSPIRSRL